MFNVERMNQAAVRSKTAPIVIAVLLLICASAHAGVSAPAYTLTDLNTLPAAAASQGTAINDRGQVAGEYQTANPYPTLGGVFVATSGKMVSILAPDYPTIASASSINNNGQVVGYTALLSHGQFFEYTGGSVEYPAGGGSLAYGINDVGQVVGYAAPNPQFHSAFLYKSGSLQFLPQLALAVAINASGQIAGEVGPSPQQYDAVIYTNGNVQDLGTLGGSSSTPNAINDSGQVVGESATPTSYHAFLYSNGVMQDLTPAAGQSTATGINASGEVVGNYLFRTGDVPFVDADGALFDLNSLIQDAPPGYVLLDANGINSSGQIVGTARSPSGVLHAVLLTPTAVPLPSAAWASLTAFPILLLRKQLRRVIA